MAVYTNHRHPQGREREANQDYTGGQAPKRQAEELAAKVSQDFEAFYQHRASRGPEETLDPLVMSEDGKGIVRCFFVPGCQGAEGWVGERALQILRGKASDVATGMRRSATLRDLGPRRAKRGRACRHLVKDRMDITGARWRLRSAEAAPVAPLGDTEAYWAFHGVQSIRVTIFHADSATGLAYGTTTARLAAA